jgi:hypothetical protein
MNALNTTIDVETAEEVRTSSHPASPDERRSPAADGAVHCLAHDLADWLGLAAAPTFALMALLTGVPGGAPPDLLCAMAQGASPLGGMAAMYLLMSAFHLGPWLKLIAARRNGPGPVEVGKGGPDVSLGHGARPHRTHAVRACRRVGRAGRRCA